MQVQHEDYIPWDDDKAQVILSAKYFCTKGFFITLPIFYLFYFFKIV